MNTAAQFGDSSGWLIEKGDTSRPQYLTVSDRRWDWTYDHMKAIRFARQEDAARTTKHFLIAGTVMRIAEHSWYRPQGV